MAQTTPRLKKLEQGVQREVMREFADLEQARDEIRLALHMAGMDAKTSWRDLEKNLMQLEERVEREGGHIADETRALARELRKSLKEFKARL